MGRFVGTRSLQRLKDALTPYRAGPFVLLALEQHAQHKTLNELEKAVQDFLRDPFAQLELLAFYAVHDNICSPLFMFIKNVIGEMDTRWLPPRKRKKGGELPPKPQHKRIVPANTASSSAAATSPPAAQPKTKHIPKERPFISQFDVKQHCRYWLYHLETVANSPAQLLDGSAALVLGGSRNTWDARTVKMRILLSHHVLDFLKGKQSQTDTKLSEEEKDGEEKD